MLIKNPPDFTGGNLYIIIFFMQLYKHKLGYGYGRNYQLQYSL